MKKRVIIVLVILVVAGLAFCGFTYWYNEGGIDNTYKLKLKNIPTKNVTMTLYYDQQITEANWSSIGFEIKDEEILKRLKEELKNTTFSGSEFVTYWEDNAYQVKFSNDLLVTFNPNFNGHIYVVYKKRHYSGTIDRAILKKLVELANSEYMKSSETLKTDQLTIYSYDTNISSMVEETDQKKLSDFSAILTNARLEQKGDICYTPEAVRIRTELEEPYYEIVINKCSTLYADEDFRNVYLEKKTCYTAGMSSMSGSFVLKASGIDSIRKILDIYKINENGQIIECGVENEITTIRNEYIESYARVSASAEDRSLSNEGIRVVLRLTGSSSFGRARDNDFIIYKENDGVWEELEAHTYPDEITINKNADVITEKINWTEKYGVLEPGIYKLERKINISDVENLYFVTFEIK